MRINISQVGKEEYGNEVRKTDYNLLIKRTKRTNITICLSICNEIAIMALNKLITTTIWLI